MRSPQPNSLKCFICGLENPYGLHLRFFESEPGEVIAEVTVPEHFQGYPGIVHGGIIAAMLDEAAGRTQMGTPDAPHFMFTGRLDIHYRKNVPVNSPLRLIGRAGKRKGRVAKASSAIYDLTGILLAEAEVMMVDIPASDIQKDDLEALGWKVYPQA